MLQPSVLSYKVSPEVKVCHRSKHDKHHLEGGEIQNGNTRAHKVHGQLDYQGLVPKKGTTEHQIDHGPVQLLGVDNQSK